ncbi:hypothetical protein CJ030_MR7G010607 [Morella rubra]|uniref:Uncharacterized protein n=1 Tax=Morella rubra TaxID=262757 RepID=A0A6A1V2H0_9ROSI|nr:hypothetical protein CJ030_MR7G010609 [Morella rubra]KAB1205452.1 hypothetical protein CJ030_MR7G010607 [Morella rubra]
MLERPVMNSDRDIMFDSLDQRLSDFRRISEITEFLNFPCETLGNPTGFCERPSRRQLRLLFNIFVPPSLREKPQKICASRLMSFSLIFHQLLCNLHVVKGVIKNKSIRENLQEEPQGVEVNTAWCGSKQGCLDYYIRVVRVKQLGLPLSESLL